MALGIRRNDIFRQIPADSNIFHSDSVGIHRNDIFRRIPADCSESAGFRRNPWGRVKYWIPEACRRRNWRRKKPKGVRRKGSRRERRMMWTMKRREVPRKGSLLVLDPNLISECRSL
jgi:hypothetical protein